MEELESQVATLKSSLQAAADAPRGWRLEQQVDSLIYLFYDDIGSIKQISLRSLFDLFLIKVLYVGRGERDLQVLDYLSAMLNRFLLTRELVRLGARFDFLYSLLEEMKERGRFQNLFEASRHMGDNALFVTGIFPAAAGGRRRLGAGRLPRLDRAHFMELGRRYYRVAAQEPLAEVVGQRDVLVKLSDRFPFYMETLSELSQRFILGFDMDIVANKMLDALNLYRQTGDERHMENARKYAALLRVERSLPGYRRRVRGRVLEVGQEPE